MSFYDYNHVSIYTILGIFRFKKNILDDSCYFTDYNLILYE